MALDPTTSLLCTISLHLVRISAKLPTCFHLVPCLRSHSESCTITYPQPLSGPCRSFSAFLHLRPTYSPNTHMHPNLTALLTWQQ
ncbi:hypothetical protein BD309DRAFT_480277 [Dichomitus squalens]|nr:hypothetical protein BD309DRAFT_480277 [Dichomitus squalens]